MTSQAKDKKKESHHHDHHPDYGHLHDDHDDRLQESKSISCIWHNNKSKGIRKGHHQECLSVREGSHFDETTCMISNPRSHVASHHHLLLQVIITRHEEHQLQQVNCQVCCKKTFVIIQLLLRKLRQSSSHSTLETRMQCNKSKVSLLLSYSFITIKSREKTAKRRCSISHILYCCSSSSTSLKCFFHHQMSNSNDSGNDPSWPLCCIRKWTQG